MAKKRLRRLRDIRCLKFEAKLPWPSTGNNGPPTALGHPNADLAFDHTTSMT